MYNLMDFICIVCGVYLMYVGIVMKTQGKINANVVLSKNITENAIRDREGFIRYLYGKLVLIGAVIALSGVVNLVFDLQGGNGTVSLITYVVFIAAMVVYVKVVSNALKKYTR